MKFVLHLVALLLVLAFGTSSYADDSSPLPLAKLRLPPGFKISIYARNVTGARSMALSPRGTLYVGTREHGFLYAIPDADKNGVGDTVVTLGSKMFHPNGVGFRDNSLFVAEVNRILRYDNIDARINNPPKPVVVNGKDLPNNPAHGQKYIGFGPDGWLYVPIGAPCNICEEKDPRFATMCRMKVDGSGFEIYSKGIRNTVGFDWHPVTKELWFTDNGRDMLGDNLPPEELNCAPKAGMHFGFPYCHAGELPDPEFGKKRKCSEFTPPALKMPAHVAPLGMKFYTGKMFPEEYKNCAFICEHGSWNRSVPDGYRVSVVRFNKDNKPSKYETFIGGWLQPSGVWGRPVDVLVMPDGALLVSDDHAGVIYRVSYSKKN